MLSQAKSAQRVNPPIRRTSRGRPYYPERCPRKKTFWLRLRSICAQSNFAAVWIVKHIISEASPLTTLRALAVPPLRSANGKRGLRPDKKWLLCAVVGSRAPASTYRREVARILGPFRGQIVHRLSFRLSLPPGTVTSRRERCIFR
jgi:hypothetical protein